jgi:undecaprenyl pyrophosphate phosphatase UppP
MSENGYLRNLRNVWLTFATVMAFIVALTVTEWFVTWTFQIGVEDFDILAVVVALIGIFFGGGAAIKYASTHKIKEADDGDDS